MTTTNSNAASAEPFDPRAELRRRIDELLVGADDDAGTRFLTLRDDVEAFALPLRRALLATPLAWTGEECRSAGWLQRCTDDLGAIGYRLALRGAPRMAAGDAEALGVAAAALYYMGEAVKWSASIAPEAPHDMRKVHGLMRLSIEHGREREALGFAVEGRRRECTLESLYFRVLLLARHGGGELNAKQIEILDAWMWMWMPVLKGVTEPPRGTALRADLDSAGGLQFGPREGEGPSLYLPPEPIEAAYCEVVAQFHEGRIVPSEGIASEFRIEEHVAVLALLRRNLRHARREPTVRAERRSVGRAVELFVGLTEIVKRGFSPAAPQAPLALAAIDPKPHAMRIERDYDTAVGGIYDPERRIVRLLDESDTGLGIEGEGDGLAGVAAGDLVAVRLAEGEPLVFGKVVRSVASKTPGHTVIGVRRLCGAARLIEAEREAASHSAGRAGMVFVEGGDSSGRQDGLLVTEREFIDRAPLVVSAADRQFRLRVNRARERGRGWVLAGFEVVSARQACEIEIA